MGLLPVLSKQALELHKRAFGPAQDIGLASFGGNCGKIHRYCCSFVLAMLEIQRVLELLATTASTETAEFHYKTVP